MPATITHVVKQFQQQWTDQLAPEAILTACRGVAYRWRERSLNPVTTIQLFLVQILHGNTACTHLRHLTKLHVGSAYCQARMKRPLAVFQQLLRSVSYALQHEPLDEGRWGGHRTFWGMAPVVLCPIHLYCKTISANPVHNCRGADALLPISWPYFMPGRGWCYSS